MEVTCFLGALAIEPLWGVGIEDNVDGRKKAAIYQYVGSFGTAISILLMPLCDNETLKKSHASCLVLIAYHQVTKNAH